MHPLFSTSEILRNNNVGASVFNLENGGNIGPDFRAIFSQIVGQVLGNPVDQAFLEGRHCLDADKPLLKIGKATIFPHAAHRHHR